MIDQALKFKSAPEFSTKNDHSQFGLLALQLLAAKAYYKTLPAPERTLNPEAEKIAISTLKEFSKKADGKKWFAYSINYHRLIVYYILKGKDNFKNAEIQLDKLLDYNQNEIVNYLNWGMNIKLPASKAEEKINAYLKNGGTYSYPIVLLRLKYKAQTNENVFYDCIDFLNEFYVWPVADINTVLKFLRNSLDTTDTEQVKEYYNTLNRLAFVQQNNEERMKLVSDILDERKKIEMIFENIKNNHE